MQITKPLFSGQEIKNVQTSLDSGWVTQGPFTAEFEKRICALHQVKYGLAVTSCTAALHIAAHALNLGPNDEVIVPAFTWITSANTAEYVGAKVVFADINPNTFNLDPQKVEDAITPATKAIVAVHLFGLSAPMDELKTIADKHDLYIIEDAACAIGTTYKGRPVGGLGDIGCFSFHPRKVITTGEGGMATTNDEHLASLLGSLRNHGSAGVRPEEAYERQPWTMARFPYLGFNYRMSDIQAAVGCAQLDKLEGLLTERRACAKRYDQLLKDQDAIMIPSDPDGTEGHSYQSYVIRLKSGDREERNRLMIEFSKENIEVRPGTHAVHNQEYYQSKYHLTPSDYPMSTLCEHSSITLPIFPGMTESEQEKVVQIIKETL